MSRYNTQDINKILRTIDGWEEAKKGKGTMRHKTYGTQKYYLRICKQEGKNRRVE